MNPIRTGVFAFQTAFYSSRVPRRRPRQKPAMIPTGITITLSTDKLFENNQLNTKYITDEIGKRLKPYLPQKVIVHDKTPPLNLKLSQPTELNRPSSGSGTDLILYYLLFQNVMANNNSHVVCQYDGSRDRHFSNEEDDTAIGLFSDRVPESSHYSSGTSFSGSSDSLDSFDSGCSGCDDGGCCSD